MDAYKITVLIKRKIQIELTRMYYKLFFKHMGKKTYIVSPLHIDNPHSIYLGSNVIVREFTWLASVPLTGNNESLLAIGDGTTIGHFNHIYATHKIIIEKNVLTADKVYISDNLHEYRDITLPIKCQPVIQNREVIIGEGTWIGENACVLGVKIGKHCVIAANSVVNQDIPDYCVVAGVPAKIVKRYCVKSQKWYRTTSKGDYIY